MPFGKVAVRPFQRRADVPFCARERFPGNFHQVEHTTGDLPHQFMLRFIPAARPAAVSDYEQYRDIERIRQRRQRVDRITQARVLHHRHGAPPAHRQSGRGGDGIALVGGRDIGKPFVIDDVIDKRSQVRAGHPRVMSKPKAPRGFNEGFSVDHFSPYIRKRLLIIRKLRR